MPETAAEAQTSYLLRVQVEADAERLGDALGDLERELTDFLIGPGSTLGATVRARLEWRLELARKALDDSGACARSDACPCSRCRGAR